MRARAEAIFPKGWKDFAVQVGIWLGFALAYQIARGIADRGALQAFDNGRLVIDAERGLHTLVELDIQRVILHTGGFLLDAVNWTYWLSQFPVLGLGLLWIYFFRNESFLGVRNLIILTNMLALVGYVLMPTAPPRMFPDVGFVDTLAMSSPFSHESGLVQVASNPYAAMPSVHAADALVIGFALASLVAARWLKVLWTLWPTWVWFSVMATGNHFWLDVAAGIGAALLAAALLAWLESRRGVTEAVMQSRRW